MNSQDISRIGFDTYQRYKKFADIIDVLRRTENETEFTILDVGGYPGIFEQFVPDTLTILDTFECNKDNYVQASGLDLPFDDNSFDIVTSSDVIEHIALDNREHFINELIRTSPTAQVAMLAAIDQFKTNTLEAFNQLK